MERKTEMPEKEHITYEILEHIGVISRYDSGWTKELNIISWNGGTAKYDLRDWDAYHERMKRGITLFDAELRKLVELYLNNNSQKAVERGRALEAQRKARRREQIENTGGVFCGSSAADDLSEPSAAEEEACREALPPLSEPVPEGEELPQLFSEEDALC